MRKSPHVDVRGEFLSPFLIDTCEISLQTHFSYVADTSMYIPYHNKWALAWYGKLTWESAHAWILKILCYLIVWGITLIFMARLSFYAIPLLIYDVMNDITIIP